MIAIFCNAYKNPNGATTFTEHLVKMLHTVLPEERVNIYRISSTSAIRKPKPVSNFSSLIAEEVTIDQALQIAANNPCLMTNFMQKGIEEEYARKLIEETACPYIIHDSRSFLNDIVTASIKSQAKMVFIRPAIWNGFHKENPTANTTFLPHPYVRHSFADSKLDKVYNAVSISRIGREKRIEILCGANKLLKKDRQIEIFGAMSDRLYAHFTLDKDFPEWKLYYHGNSTGHSPIMAYCLCNSSNFVVDMTTFKQDGGGSQYTFLEAMDTNTCLVINSEWLNYPGEMKQNYNCVSASDEKELAKILSGSPVELPGYSSTLALHSTEAIGKCWADICLHK